MKWIWRNVLLQKLSYYGVVGLLFFWIIVLMFISNRVFHQSAYYSGDVLNEETKKFYDLQTELNQLRNENRKLLAENQRLKKQTQETKKNKEKEFLRCPDRESEILSPKIIKSVPNFKHNLYSKQHEINRRQLNNLIWETYYYLNDQLPRINTTGPATKFVEHVNEQFIALLAEAAEFGSTVDNSFEWHNASLQNLTDRIQATIYRVQNPVNCSAARILLCNLNKNCGFGCQLHHVTYCLIVALASNRTMIMENDGALWNYSEKGWNAVFKPVTNCLIAESLMKAQVRSWKGTNQKTRIVSLQIIDTLNSQPDQLPLSFPQQFADILLTHHGNPPVFFLSQFLGYLMRENTKMSAVIQKAEENIQFKKGPIVGLQIRRTDKINTEAAFHEVGEYMKWAELWFRIQERRTNRTNIKRRVFVASDDPNAEKQIKNDFPNYEVYFNKGIAEIAQLKNRYTDASLIGVITDIRILSKCDYIVCTFSSQVCRLSYELMQLKNDDASENFHSLDDIYYFGGQLAHQQVAVRTYNVSQTNKDKLLEIEKGDVIGIAGNHWNGFSMGQNKRTGRSGLYPAAMITAEKWRIVDFPIFDESALP